MDSQWFDAVVVTIESVIFQRTFTEISKKIEGRSLMVLSLEKVSFFRKILGKGGAEGSRKRRRSSRRKFNKITELFRGFQYHGKF